LDIELPATLPASDDFEEFEPIDASLWTIEILSALNSFGGIRELTLRHFDFSDDETSQALRGVCENLRVLRLEKNFGVTRNLTSTLLTDLQHVHSIEIDQAELSHEDLAALIFYCPKLTSLRLRNIGDDFSFKELVKSAHAVLHTCNSIRMETEDELRPLNLSWSRGQNYLPTIPNETDELKIAPLCGAKLLLSNNGEVTGVIICRVCEKD